MCSGRLAVVGCIVSSLAWLGSQAMATLNPGQVLVVYNSQSTDASAVKNAYLAAHPDIPAANVLDLNSTAIANRADITYAEFTSTIRNPIRAHIDLNADVIASICLIRGIPHRIQDTDSPTVGDNPTATSSELNGGDVTCASVDAELVLLWQDLEAGEAGASMDSHADNFVQNPYHGVTADIQGFSRGYIKNAKTFAQSGLGWRPGGTKQNVKLTPGDMYLVCRIDGATAASAIDSIARATDLHVNRTRGWVILDEDARGDHLDDDDYFFAGVPDYENTRDHLRTAGFNVVYDNTSTFVTSTSFTRPVIAYASYGENHSPMPPNPSTYIAGFHFPPGAIFNTIESYNGRALNGLGTLFSQEQVGDFIAAGGTFGIGHVWEPFTIGLPDNDDLLGAMLLRNATWAEAAWSSIPLLSWMHVVIGDPLGRVIEVVDQPADFDADADVDQQDFEYVRNCSTGPGLGPPTPACAEADLNQDGSIDSIDFARLQRCYSAGPSTLNPECE